MLIKQFIKAIKEARAESGYAQVGNVKGDGKANQERRSVPVAKLPKRLNAAEAPKEVKKPAMGGRKDQKPTADVGNVTGDGIAFSGRRPVSVAKTNEGEVSLLSDDDLVLED